jgi:hypothetical protein
MTLAEFLLARIDEDEGAAGFEEFGMPVPGNSWGPERVLAECEAKRRIVNDAGFAVHQAEINKRAPHTEPVFAAALLGKHVLNHLARPYADHPDYRQEWASAS